MWTCTLVNKPPLIGALILVRLKALRTPWVTEARVMGRNGARAHYAKLERCVISERTRAD